MMKKHYKHLAVLGTLCCVAALAVLWLAVLTVDWVSIQEPQLDPLELDKLGPYEEPKPHLIRAKFGLFKMCVQQQHSLLSPPKSSIGNVDSLVVNTNQNSATNPSNSNSNSNYGGTSMSPIECIDLDWYNFGLINFDTTRKPPQMPTELIANCVEKLRFTLPFIGLSVLFTSISFLCLTFGYFCQKNKKIIEASLLILAGLCQATALLTFVSQIGSEFEANLPYSHHHKKLTTFYRYKYGYSFYLFLLSFSLSELAALFDMAAYFRKYPPNHYVITFHRQEPSPFMGTTSSSAGAATAATTANNTNMNHSHHLHAHHLNQQQLGQTSNYASDSLASRSNHNNYSTTTNSSTNNYPNNYHSQHHTYSQNYPTTTNSNSASTTLSRQIHGPDLCSDFINNDQMIDLTLHHHQHHHHTTMGQLPGLGPGPGTMRMNVEDSNGPLPPPQSFMNPEVTITTIERNNGYGTLRGNKLPESSAMESFGTMRKENNI